MNSKTRSVRPSDPFKPYRGQAGKSVEERIAYALGHRTRLVILTLLAEGTYTITQIAQLIDEPRDNVKHHIKEMLDGGLIELAKEEEVGKGAREFYYRAIRMSHYTAEDVEVMTAEELQEIVGLTIQHVIAEVLASFWSGKMVQDPRRLWLGWRWFNLDAQGRDDLARDQERWWHRAQEIEAESASRSLSSGEETESVIVSIMGFPRERTAPDPPEPPANFSERR
jgi:DNA-binding transcriptional ArsR family regulator